MPLKKAAAAERRMDLASFFCMIGRHGPAVALAVVAVVTVLAGFYIYRTVKGKRREADGAPSPGEEEEEEEEEEAADRRNQRRSGESTDVSDEGFSDDMEEAGSLRLRHRPPAEKKPPPAAVPRAAQTTSEETHRRLAPPTGEGPLENQDLENQNLKTLETMDLENQGLETLDLKNQGLETLDLENQDLETLDLENQEVELKPDDGDVSSGRKPGREEKTEDPHATTEVISKDAEDVPASLVHPSKGEKIEGPEEEKVSADQPSEVEAPPSVQDRSGVGDEGLSGGATKEEEEEESHNEERKQENGPVCDGEEEEEELRRECSSLLSQRQTGDQTSPRVDENSESFFNGPEKPPPETGRELEPPGDLTTDPGVSDRAEETSRLPPTELASAPGASPDMFPDPPTCSVPPQKDDDGDGGSSAGAGAESGISSLAVSPDIEAHMMEAMEAEPQTEAPDRLYADDAVLSVVEDQVTQVIFGSVQSCSSQMFHSESIHWTQRQTLVANEDTFGHEIEDSYHRAIDLFAAQASISQHLTDIRRSLTSVEPKEKRSIKEDSEMEVDYERTEISIMEATMDHNEWITDGAAPVPPWLTHSPLDPPKPIQVPSDQSPAPQASAADVPPPPDVHQLFADEIVDHFKKVVAVQPMPQNVNVTFRVHYSTQSPYQTVAVTGDQPELGSWKEFIPLEKVREGHWSAVVSLPSERSMEWKFVLLDKGEVCRWEECGNRLLDTGVGDDVVVHKWWGLV